MKNLIYSVTICILAVISVIFAFIDMSSGLNNWMRIVDISIYFIFLADYVIRLSLSESKKHYLKDNIFDLIAILPISSSFRIFRTFKVFKLAKLTKFTRLVATTGRFFNLSKKFFNTNGFKYMLLLSTTLIIIGGSLISFFEHIPFSDGIWWAFVTSTTVGYGDISPQTAIGRIIACVLMLNGIGLIGSLTSTITSFFIHDNTNTVSSDKIDMVLKLYDELNESEKQNFKDKIK